MFFYSLEYVLYSLDTDHPISYGVRLDSTSYNMTGSSQVQPPGLNTC